MASQVWKVTFLFLLSATSFLSVQSLFRGYREACGTHLHARSRDTVAEGRQCDKSKGLTCTRQGVCDCVTSNVEGVEEQTVWNKTHCVARLNTTCIISQSYVPELSFLPNVTRMEELLCGRGAVCTTDGCICESDMQADISHLNCVSDSGQSSTLPYSFPLWNGIALIFGASYIMWIC